MCQRVGGVRNVSEGGGGGGVEIRNVSEGVCVGGGRGNECGRGWGVCVGVGDTMRNVCVCVCVWWGGECWGWGEGTVHGNKGYKI